MFAIIDEILPAPVAWLRLPIWDGEPVDYPPDTRCWGWRESVDGDIYQLVEHSDLPMVEDATEIPIVRLTWQYTPPTAVWDKVE